MNTERLIIFKSFVESVEMYSTPVEQLGTNSIHLERSIQELCYSKLTKYFGRNGCYLSLNLGKVLGLNLKILMQLLISLLFLLLLIFT